MSAPVAPRVALDIDADRVPARAEAASDVVEFYNFLNGFRSSIRTALGGEGVSIEGRIATIDFVLDVIFDQLPKAEALRTELLRIAGRRWVLFAY